MQRLLLDCVDGVYIAKYGHLSLVLTQDEKEAGRVGEKYTGTTVCPRWWSEETNINTDTYAMLMDTVVQIQKALGSMGMCEFCSVRDGNFYLSGFSI
jgi:hypothetical protein